MGCIFSHEGLHSRPCTSDSSNWLSHLVPQTNLWKCVIDSWVEPIRCYGPKIMKIIGLWLSLVFYVFIAQTIGIVFPHGFFVQQNVSEKSFLICINNTFVYTGKHSDLRGFPNITSRGKHSELRVFPNLVA